MVKISMRMRIVSLALIAVMLLGCIPGVASAVDTGTDIQAIQRPTGLLIAENYDDYFGDSWLEALDLPKFVTVTLAGGNTVEVPVTWDATSLDPRTPGYYFLPGTFTLPSGATNSKNLDVSITIRVQEAKNLFSNPSFEVDRSNWGFGYDCRMKITPAAAGNYAIAVQSNAGSASTSYRMFEAGDAESVRLATLVAELGAGQYYIGGQAKDYTYAGEATHSAPLSVCITLYTSKKADKYTETFSAQSDAVTISFDDYVTTGGVFTLDGKDAWVRPKLQLKSNTAFKGEWILADDMQFIPLKVALKVEPSNIAEIKTQIQSRYVAVNYDKYAGTNWREALGLPATVEVVMDNDNTASVDVTWNYSHLDFSKPGKQVVIGKLDDSGFPNPKGLQVYQVLYVRETENLFSNPSFENGFRGTWGPGYDARTQVTPAALGNFALAVQSNGNYAYTSYRMFETSDTESVDLAAKVAQWGAGQYYFSAQARDYTLADEAAHTAPLSVYLAVYNSKTANKNTETINGETAAVTISADEYVTIGGVFSLDGKDAWIRPKLFLKSSTAFSGEWILADDMVFMPLNVLIPLGEEPADVSEIIGEIPQRLVVQNYDQYVSGDWKQSLGLPATVEVKTSKGLVASVGIIWDYSPLNLSKVGEYTLIGKLDDSLYPNPDELYVVQKIYIREAKNLLRNSDFESGWNYWSVGYDAKQNLTPAALGKYAVGIQSNANSPSKSYRMIETSVDESTTLAAKIAEYGAGQYYLSAQARDYVQAGEVQHTDPLSVAVAIYHSTVADMYTEKLVGESLAVTISDSQYVKARGIFELDGTDAWVRPKLLLKSNSAFAGQWILADDIQLIPLNTIVTKYEGAMEEVESIIPDRQIIKDYPNYVPGYTTADLMLPESVQVRSTTGQIVNIGVTWNLENLDLSKVGTYTVVGKLENMKLDNPDGLSVQQNIRVVDYKNLLTNPSFESDNKYWALSERISTRVGITSPVKDGSFAVKVTIGTLTSYKENWLQAYKYNLPSDLGETLTRTGSGRYYFGGWGHGTSSSEDVAISPRLWYETASTGNTLLSQIAPQTTLSADGYVKAGDFVDLPDDVTWARLDVYFHGTPAQMKQSVLYLDNLELVPLNVEVPKLNDIISCEKVADIFVHEGASVADLKLPETLEILLKNAQKFNVSVDWDTSTFDPNQIGEQIITGSLALGSKYMNSKGFVPTAKITVRAKGEDLRQTIYISSSGGDESNDGLSPATPKKDALKIPTYLAKGYNVRLKRGDVWELPTGSFTFQDLHGTEDAPLIVGCYGEGGALPMIRFMLKIDNSAWELVDAKRNVYATKVSSLGTRDGLSVHRCFVDDEAYLHQERSTYVALKAGEFCSYDGMLYVRTEGGAPQNVEVTPLAGVANRLYIEDVSHLTIEFIHFKGSSAVNNFCKMMAPTAHVKFSYVSITHCFYYIITMDSTDDRIHYKPEISNCYIDSNFSKAEGYVTEGLWAHSRTEGITMRDGVDGAWIHHNHIVSMSHAFVAIETLDTATEPKITGVRNCIMEDNLFEGGNAVYARAVNITGGFSKSGIQMCRNNIFRRNKCYDMSTSSHLYGENNLVYSNIFSYTHCEFDEDGVLVEGKTPQPWGFDSIPWGEQTTSGDMVINNTFYDVSGAVAMWDQSDAVYNNLIANNLVVNWGSDPKTVYSISGAIYDNTTGMQYVMNNAVYSAKGKIDHFVVDGDSFLAADVNGTKAGYSGNLSGDPKFVNADLTQLGKGVRLDFTLSGESPFRYAGLSINATIYENFPMWKVLQEEYTDINGVLYLAESPSIGAVSYCERIAGEVASVDNLDDIVVRAGATYESLPLPDTVRARNDEGIEVVLLIDWSSEGYDSSANSVTLTGALRNGPHTELNVAGKTVSLTVQLLNKLTLKDIVTNVADFTVFYNTSFEDVVAQLPAKLEVVEEHGFEEELPVTWICENYDPTDPDIYTFKCVLPEDLITNANDRDFDLRVDVRVLHEIGRGSELLINPDFIDGSSATPWKTGWGTSYFSITQLPQYLVGDEPAVAIVTAEGRYTSIQQDVTGQMKLMGDGKYLFVVHMRAYDASETIDSTYACLQLLTPTGEQVLGTRAEVDVGIDWVCLTSVFNVKGVEDAREIMFHTSTGKTEEDIGKRFIIGGCSLVYLGTTDKEVEATKDSVDLVWNTIRGENLVQGNVMTDLTLPAVTGTNSTVKWSSSDESIITSDGKVIMSRVPQNVVLTATITHTNGIETVKKFAITVPRDPSLPVYTGSLNGAQTVKPGDTFDVVLSLDAENVTSFNAYRFTMFFNTSLLEYVGISDTTATAVMQKGQLEIYGIGTDRPITDTITITFRAKKTGLTEVKLVKVEMDPSGNVSMDELPTMFIENGTSLIEIKAQQGGDVSAEPAEESWTMYIIIGIAVVVVLVGTVVVILVRKKKKAAK